MNLRVPKDIKIGEKTLQEIIELHNKYLEGDPKGVRANFNKNDLTEVDLRGFDLSKANFKGANLFKVNFENSILIGADFRGSNLNDINCNYANLSGADLSKANLYEVSFFKTDLSDIDLRNAVLNRILLIGTKLYEAKLSGAKIDRASIAILPLIFEFKKSKYLRFFEKYFTFIFVHIFHPLRGCTIGVNGIYCKKTDSAALVKLMPPGDSMIGNKPEAILESLTQARRLHFISLSLALLAVAVKFLKPEGDLELSFFPKLPIPTEDIALIGLLISTVILTLVKSFFGDALRGAHYLQDRNSAMLVGNFPWALSRYSGGAWYKIIQSLLTRIIYAFHPLVYFFCFPKYYEEWYYIFPILLIFIFCTWIFIISQQFQKPILFDVETEKQCKSDAEKITQSIDELKELIDERLPKPEKEKAKETKVKGTKSK